MESIDFDGLRIDFDHRVLRPRPWTAQQSLWAAALLADLPAGPVLELCSGAGHIGLRAVRHSERPLVCVDANPVAAAYTTANAATAGMSGRVEMRQGFIADVLGPNERFVMVIADPPWVPREETGRFPEDPLLAIDGGDDGMIVVRECLAAMERNLAPGGIGLLQLGTAAQAEAVAEMCSPEALTAGEFRTYADRGVVLRLDRPA